MEYDESKILEVEISQNQFVEDRKMQKPRRIKRANFDVLDLVIIPVVIGVFVSLGFLFANIFKATEIVDTLNNISSIIANI